MEYFYFLEWFLSDFFTTQWSWWSLTEGINQLIMNTNYAAGLTLQISLNVNYIGAVPSKLSVYLSIYLSIYLSVCLSIDLSIDSSIHPSTHPWLYSHFVRP
jgi:hypothetical protein